MSDKLVVDLQPDKHRHCSEDKGDGTDPSLYNFADEQFCPHGPVPFSHVIRYVNRTWNIYDLGCCEKDLIMKLAQNSQSKRMVYMMPPAFDINAYIRV